MVGGLVGVGSLSRLETQAGRLAADGSRDPPGVAGEDLSGLVTHPGFGVSVSFPDGSSISPRASKIYAVTEYILHPMTKRLIDIDDVVLNAARVRLGTKTMKETVNEALRRAVEDRSAAVIKSLDLLARAGLSPREDAWR